jgi:proliferating cell nuclear antigen
MSSSYSIEIKTVQSSAFKILVEALKELLTECSFEIDETGIKLVSMDTSHTILVHMKLDAPKFEYFYCKQKTVIGINMINFQKLIKTINSNDALTLYMENDNMNYLGIRIENNEKNTKTNYKLNLIDLDRQEMNIDPAAFNNVITLPSNDFMKLIRDMNNIADYVEIQNIKNQLIFQCKGDFCHQETILSDSEDKVQCSHESEEIVQGVFNLKYLVLFTKCTNLCNTVFLYLRNNYPLICQYMVASLGEIKLCIAPQRI